MEKLKQNRTASFIAVALVYIIAAVAGVLVYRALDLAWWLSLLIADAVATVATFLFSLLFQNASVYDPYWSVQPPVILAAVALRRTIESSSALRIGFFTDRLSQKENHPKGWFSFWRRGRDSNPRVIAHKLISSQPRYDHFDTSACYLDIIA